MDPLLRTESVALAVIMGLAGCVGPATLSEPTAEVPHAEEAEDLPTPVFLLAPPEATLQPPTQSQPTVVPLEWTPVGTQDALPLSSRTGTKPIRWTFEVNESGTLQSTTAFVWVRVSEPTANTVPQVGGSGGCLWYGFLFMGSSQIALGCGRYGPPVIDAGEFLLTFALRSSEEVKIEESSDLSFELFAYATSPSVRPSVHVLVGTEKYDSRVELDVVPTGS